MLPGLWVWWIQRDKQITSSTAAEQCSGIITGKAAGFLYWSIWMRTGLYGECLAYWQGGTSEPPIAWWLKVRRGCFFLSWEGLKKIPLTLVLCDEVCSVTGRSSPTLAAPSRGSQISWKKTVEIRRVSLCSVYRVTKTFFWDSNRDRIAFSSCF